MSLIIQDDYLHYDNGQISVRLWMEITRANPEILKFIYEFINHTPCSIGLNDCDTVEIILWDDDHVDIEIAPNKSHNATIVSFKYEDCKDVIVKYLISHVLKKTDSV
jgi:hypothetical protein